MSYLVVGGNPFRHSFTGLYKIGLVETYKEVVKLVEENYDACSGLIEVFDTETGETPDF